MKTFIVTGGAGFIGSHLVNTLLKLGNKVICIDKLSYASDLNNIDKDNYNFYFCQADIADTNFINDFTPVFKLKIDGIYHLAAESHVDNSISNPSPFIDSNVKGTLNILELAKRSGAKLLYISTDETVGSIKDGWATENSPLETNSVYSASKAAGELLCQSYISTHDLNINITRCGNNYGPHQHREKFISKTIVNALGNIDIPVYGSGKNIRQWTYVQNHVDDLILLMENDIKSPHKNIFHVGGGEHFDNNQIVDTILEKLNKPKTLIKFVEDRKGHDFRYSIKISKNLLELRNLNKKEYISFGDGINKTIDWYKNKYV